MIRLLLVITKCITQLFLFWFSSALSFITLSVILIIGWLFFTSLGGQWLLQQVPGLTLSGFQGQLLGKWQAKNVQWQSPNLSLKIQGLVFDWQPRCLLERKVCFNDLQLTAVHIKTATPPKAAPLPIDWASLRLPAIELPHLDLLELAFLQGIEVNNLVIGDLKLNDQQQLSHLQLAVTWQATRIDLKNLQVQSPFLLGGISTKAHLSGWLMTEKNWPLNLKLTSELSEAPIKVNLSGDFSKLNLQARLIATTASASFAEKHSDIHLKGWVNLLQPAAPIQLSLNWQNLDLHKIHPKFASLPDAIQLQQGALNLQGDLAKGWRLKLDTKQQLNNQPLILNLAANLSWEKLQIENLSIYLDKANWLALDLDLNLERWQANLDVKITDLDVLSSRLISLIHTFSPKLITEPQLAALLVEPLLAGDLQLDSHFEMPAIVSSEALQKALTQSHFQLNLASQFLRYTNLQLEKTDLALTYNGQENHQDPSLSLAFTSQQLQQGQAIDLDEGAERLLLKNLRLHLVGLLSKHKLISGLILDDQPLELSFDGGVQLKNLDDVQWRYQLATLSTQLLTPWLPEDLRWIDEIGGDIDGQWRNQQLQASLVLNGGPGELAVKLEDTLNETFTWTALNYHLLNLGLSLKDQKLTMYFTLNGEALGYLNTAVTLDLQPDSVQQQRALKGHYQLNHLQLKLFAPFIDIDKLDGQLVGQGKIRGHLLAPEVWGHLQLQKVVATDTYWPVSLQQLDGELLLQGKHLELNADFLTGEGGVGKLSGEMHWLPELAARIQLQGNAFNVRIEPYASLQVTPDLIFTYQQKKGLLAGQIKIPSGLISVQQLPKQAIKASSDAQVIGRKVVTGNNTALNLDLELLLGNVSLPNEAPLKLEVMGLEAEIQGRLRVANNMQTRGELLLVKGTFQSWGQDLKLRKARLNFAGPVSLPFLDIEAVREVQDITVGIHMTGRADRPETEIFSEPPMANEQALSWLILGRPLQTEQDENSLNAAAISFGLKQASGITGRLGESVGLKDFQLLAEGSGSDTSVVASGYISEKVSVSYGVGVYDEISRFVVRYELSRQVYIEAASSLASSLDIFWRLAF